MLLVTTPSGNSGRHVLKAALAGGQPLRVLVRKAAKLSATARSRCQIVEGDLRAPATLAQAAAGVDAAFFCVPQSGESPDVAEYYRSFAEPAARAFADAKIARVVTISGGRGDPRDVGPSGPLAAMERRFDDAGLATRHLRCGYFMENFLYMVPQLKFQRSFSLPLAPDQRLALQAAEDIGHSAARWLLDASWSGQEGIPVPMAELRTCPEIAEILSTRLGRTIRFRPVSGAEHKKTLMKYGVSEAMAQSLKEMFEDLDQGSIGAAHAALQRPGVSFADWTTRHLEPALGIVAVIRRLLA